MQLFSFIVKSFKNQKPQHLACIDFACDLNSDSLRAPWCSVLPYDFFCASPGRYAVIAFGCASCPKLTCGREGCGTEFCYHCKQLWHPNQTCDAARQQRAQSLRLRTVRSSSLNYSQESGAAGGLT